MSAITGILFLDGRLVERPMLESMVDSLAHRGPDGAGAWSDGNIGLGHRMLHTTPESLREKLPLVNQTGALVVTADARIDNRDELIATLGLGGSREEIGDSELILGAYERWGERCPERLLGDFAFAIWDRRRQRLFCARDHMGVKPFYYYWSGRALFFASEVKALLRVPEVPRRLNETRVADHLISFFEDKVSTFYRDILRLPHGHHMSVGRKGAPVRSYWSPDPSREVRFRSDGEYAEAYRELFAEAVRCRLRSAHPVGSMLSGGLDSSSIVCLAQELLSGDGHLHTFSAVFDEVPECDERVHINAILARGGLVAHPMRADGIGPLTGLERIMWHSDEALYAPNMFMHCGLYDAARESGVRVLLDGIDGDTTISHGYRRLTELTRAGRWRTLATETYALSRHAGLPARSILRFALRPLVPEPVRKVRRMLQKRPPWPADAYIGTDFARRIGLVERIRALEGDRLRLARTEREEHRRDLTSGLISFGLEEADKVAAAFSLEPRYPFYDKRLVEFCLALPPEQKLKNGWTRIIARRALAGTLPEKVRWRGGKADLFPNFNRGLLKYRRELLEEVIEDPGAIEGYVDVTALREAYRRFAFRGEEDKSLGVWYPATLALWLRQTDLSP